LMTSFNKGQIPTGIRDLRKIDHCATI
jgi:hypothetical protein